MGILGEYSNFFKWLKNRRKYLRDKNGRFRRRRKITKPIMNLIDAWSCSYWMVMGGGYFLLRQLNYKQELLKILSGDF